MKDNLSNESALRAKMQRNLPGDSWFAWRVTAITTVIATILIPLLLYFLSRPEQEPKFIIENCILRTDAVLVIKADNKKANHRKYLNIIYDGCTFPKKGVPINSNSGDIQRWHFLLNNLTQDMKKGSHWIQVCFPGGKRSEKFNIKFVNDPPIEKVTTKTQISENKIKNSNNIYKSIWVTPFRSQNTSLGEGYAKGCASQLSKAPNINIIENDIINEEINIKDSSTISNIGQLHGADYSLIGSINIIDKNLNIDARLIDNNNSKVLLYFSKKNQGREYLEMLLAYEVTKTLNSLLPLPIFEKKSNLLIKPQDKALQLFNNKKYSDAFNLYSKILYKEINNIELHRDL